jgi:hypothetical protein
VACGVVLVKECGRLVPRSIGRGSPDVPSSTMELLIGWAHQAWNPHVGERKLGTLQGTHVRGSMSRCVLPYVSHPECPVSGHAKQASMAALSPTHVTDTHALHWCADDHDHSTGPSSPLPILFCRSFCKSGAAAGKSTG